MSLYITSLNSGSNGNCYYIGNDTEAILVDAGLSCRETELRLQRLGLSMQKVKAIFISHEHIDHVRGLAVLAKKYQLPVYVTPSTIKYSRPFFDARYAMPFKGYEPVAIGALNVMPFPKLHDAADPHSFVIEHLGVKVGVFTDIGAPCAHLIDHFCQCHAALLEANYDEVMLERGRYPYHLKNRIRGGHGHLSNRQALDLFLAHRPAFMSHLLLGHLSKDNNCPKLVYELFSQEAGNTQVVIASRYEPTPIFHIDGRHLPEDMPVVSYTYPLRMVQASLF